MIQCESGGDPRNQNAESTASGLFQFIDGTWKTFGGSTAHAKDASVSEQYAVAERAYAANGLGDWAASQSCWESKIGRHASGTEAPKHAASRKPKHAADAYEVKAGDSLAEIAAAHHTSWQKVYAQNRAVIEDPNRIYPGERLHV